MSSEIHAVQAGLQVEARWPRRCHGFLICIRVNCEVLGTISQEDDCYLTTQVHYGCTRFEAWEGEVIFTFVGISTSMHHRADYAISTLVPGNRPSSILWSVFALSSTISVCTAGSLKTQMTDEEAARISTLSSPYYYLPWKTFLEV